MLHWLRELAGEKKSHGSAHEGLCGRAAVSCILLTVIFFFFFLLKEEFSFLKCWSLFNVTRRKFILLALIYN